MDPTVDVQREMTDHLEMTAPVTIVGEEMIEMSDGMTGIEIERD